VPRSLSARPGRSPLRGSPLVRAPRRLPRILGPDEVDRLVAALRTHRDRAMIWLMLLGGLRRCEVLGLRFGDVHPGERRVFIADGKGGHQRIVPVGDLFFQALGSYFTEERYAADGVDEVFVVLKGPRRGRPLTADGLNEILSVRPSPRRPGPRDLSRTAAYVFHPAAGVRDGVGSDPGAGRSCFDRDDEGLPPSRVGLVGR
jgi:integrase/recombinase XerD